MKKRLIQSIKNQLPSPNNNDENINAQKIHRHLTCNKLVTTSELKEYLENADVMINRYFSGRKKLHIHNTLVSKEKRYTQYKSPDTDEQFFALRYYKDMRIRNQLNEMLAHFLGAMYAEMVTIMIDHKCSDKEILNFIKKNYNPTDSFAQKEFSLTVIADFIDYNLPKDAKSKRILDVGCGNGKKIKKIGDILGSKVTVSGADINNWGNYDKNTRKRFDFEFKEIQLKPSYRIPFPDKSFECITLMLTLHHCSDILAVVNECSRLLTDNGFLLICEHDVWTDQTHMLLDLQHRIYATINNESFDDIYACYYNFYEWDVILSKCGFRVEYGSKLAYDTDSFYRYDIQNIVVYKKVTKN